jgi:hypothetical protein
LPDPEPSVPEPLTRAELDAAICRSHHGGLVHIAQHNSTLYFHASCHPDWPTWTRYENGALVITCSQDAEEIARVVVADG